jgi:hypothetical protein
MRGLVLLSQLLLLGWAIFELWDDGIPRSDEGKAIILIMLIATLSTLYYTLFSERDDYRKLVDERRLLEEQAKIDKLRSDAN